MITNAEDYLKELWRLNDGNVPSAAILLPKEESIYEIDLDKRTIKAPPFLSVESDHNAETIYFVCDRYYDNMDLANTTCIVQYVNALGQGRIYGVPFLDITTFSGEGKDKYIKAYVIPSNYEKGKYYIKSGDTYKVATGAFDSKADYYSFVDQPKILFPWMIGNSATAAAGIVEYSVQFYMLDDAGEKLIYSLNTRPVQSKVLQGQDVSDTAEDDFNTTDLEQILARLQRLEKGWEDEEGNFHNGFELYWLEA